MVLTVVSAPISPKPVSGQLTKGETFGGYKGVSRY